MTHTVPIHNYSFIKKVLQEIKIFGKRVAELYSTENNFIIPYSTTYQDMEKAYIKGKLHSFLFNNYRIKLMNDRLNEQNEFLDNKYNRNLF